MRLGLRTSLTLFIEPKLPRELAPGHLVVLLGFQGIGRHAVSQLPEGAE